MEAQPDCARVLPFGMPATLELSPMGDQLSHFELLCVLLLPVEIGRQVGARLHAGARWLVGRYLTKYTRLYTDIVLVLL